MRPKPSREWVMNELERLNVRVVSGRPSKELNGSDEDGNDGGTPQAGAGGSAVGAAAGGVGGAGSSGINGMNANAGGVGGANPSAATGGDLQGSSSSITASLLNAARGLGLDANFLNQRRNSSLAMSLLDDGTRESNIAAAAVAAANMSKNGDTGPHHRPLVGGGSAAAYEAARADFYRKLSEEKKGSSRDNLTVNDSTRGSLSGSQLPTASRRLSSLSGLFNGETSNNQIGDAFGSSNGSNNGAGSASAGGGGSFGLSVNPNAHYEMLKLHHMNLLNEIQETTLMMNLYQQQQLQQRQQQKKLEQEKALLAQQQLLGQSMGRSNSLGLGNFNVPPSNSIATNTANVPALPQAVPAAAPATVAAATTPPTTITTTTTTAATTIPNSTFASKNDSNEAPSQESKQEDSKATELNDHEKQLQKIKEEIEARKRQLEELEKAASSTKAPTGGNKESNSKVEDTDDNVVGANSVGDDGEGGSNIIQKEVDNSNRQLSDIREPPLKKTKIAV